MTRRGEQGWRSVLGALLLLVVLAAPGEPAAGASSEEPAIPEGPARVILPEVVEVPGGTVTLGDVAQIEGPPELVDRLAQVPVGAAPLPGRSRWLATGYLAVRFRQAGIDPDQVVVDGPERVQLATPAAPASTAPTSPAPRGLEPGVSPAVGAGLPLVARDEQVTLEAVAGSVVVQVPARALAPGRLGERIRVRNLTSGLDVEAVVVGPGWVRVEAGSETGWGEEVPQ